MPVTFHIPGALRELTGGQSKVEIEHSPATLAEALSVLWTLYPGVRDRVATEQGNVREHINIFIGDENVRYTGGLASPLSAGSEISIVPAVSGGCATPGEGSWVRARTSRILQAPGADCTNVPPCGPVCAIHKRGVRP
jgi:molybdopterin converting factor small subunit